LAAAAAFLLSGASLSAQLDCEPGWLPTFGALPGANKNVLAATVFDDGLGPALYVGGPFTSVGGVAAEGVAKWDGTGWSPLGLGVGVGFGLSDGPRALATLDDGLGGGPELYVGGKFSLAGGSAASNIARWDGTSWSGLDLGVDGPVDALTVFDDGSGPRLVVAGEFTHAGGQEANGIATWDGDNWAPLGHGLTAATAPAVRALAVFDDGQGDGPALYAAGKFTTAGTTAATNIARWNATGWSALSGGDLDADAFALAVFDDGSGPRLYVGGAFSAAGITSVSHVARWSAAGWSGVGQGFDSSVKALTAAAVDGAGAALYAGGDFTLADGFAAEHAAKWSGGAWTAIDQGVSGPVLAFAAFDDGSGGGTALYAGGQFSKAGGTAAANLARWGGSTWSSISGTGLNGSVSAMATFDDGSGTGPALHVVGDFTIANGITLNHIARWDGASWNSVGGGIDKGTVGEANVLAMAVFDDGSGSALYVGGSFGLAGGVTVQNLARWNGSEWSSVGPGPGLNYVFAMAAYNGGPAGNCLYVGGGQNQLKRWNGSTWSAVPGVLTGPPKPTIEALAVADLGAGPMLFVAGDFVFAGGVFAAHIAQWNGTAWSGLGTGLGGGLPHAHSMVAFDDGSPQGTALFLGGTFTLAGGQPVKYVAKWHGVWSGLSQELNGWVTSLAVYDDGSGPALYASGPFNVLEGIPGGRVARWTGTQWVQLGGGIQGDAQEPLESMAVADIGNGPSLLVGGGFTAGVSSGDSFLARWGGCSPAQGSWVKLPDGLAGGSGVVPDLAGSGAQLGGSAVSIALHDAKSAAPAALFVGLSNQPTPFKGGTLIPVPILLTLSLATSAAGSVTLPFAWPSGLPSGFSLYYQFAIKDAAAVQGVALSNALKSTTP
jgi:hypothetical protein